MTHRRRTSDVRALLLRHIQGGSDDTIDLSNFDSVSEEEDYCTGAHAWHCHNCPLIPTDPGAVRILIPCGHMLCSECIADLPRCPVRRCTSKKFEKIATPKMQEGDPIDTQAEAERELAERASLTERLFRINSDLADLRNKSLRNDRDLYAKKAMQEAILESSTNSRRQLQVDIDQVSLKIKMAKFIRSIEQRAQNPDTACPLINNGNVGKAYYLTTALEAQKHYHNLNNKLEQDLAAEEHRYRTVDQEKRALNKAIEELVSAAKEEDDDPEVWRTFEELAADPNAVVSSQPKRIFSNFMKRAPSRTKRSNNCSSL